MSRNSCPRCNKCTISYCNVHTWPDSRCKCPPLPNWKVKGKKHHTLTIWRWEVLRGDGKPMGLFSSWDKAMLYAATRGRNWSDPQER